LAKWVSLAAWSAAGFMNTFDDARRINSSHGAAMLRSGEQMVTEIIE
jgi:hypothetical protein